ncbi:MAG TPA: HAMP domain-containing sensor histidine kinase [Nocardioides sp.]|uniref:sensor histidine kinase n=1 Tax=Nocardioides sp. TaxID=35761 RepID=UPI002E37C712|nr:HAMP domain-containing sensor histidine kinase [Nocardioides sp.]HEX5088705.1 HAMP domain-containing sensor histidine kinase [Nocardioides sp.]
MAATTDPHQASSARPERSGVSVRVRITAAVALLTLLALSGAGLIVYVIESQRIDQAISDRVDQQFKEFDKFQQAQGASYTTVGDLLDAFLRSQVPDDNEALVSWYDAGDGEGPGPQSVSSHGYTGDDAAAFRSAANSIATDNGTTKLEDPEDDLILNAQTVERGGETGALIVVTYYGDARSGLSDTMKTYAVVSVLSLIVITGFAAAQSGRLLAPLRTLRQTADEINDSDLSRRLPETGNDDITALTRTFNRMLDRLEAAFVGQRQFLDDAGHELKTPLTVLRGHLELLDVGSPEEIAATRELLLDEIDRMSRLVGELILLAKSDRPDFVTRRPVDLTGLTVDTLAKARGLADRTWTLDETASVTVAVDEQRLTQALLQLCDNAVKHTSVGDVVALGSSYDGATAQLWVRDCGPGVPPEDREQIFERFGRSVVPESDEGFGLGLSIVRAIAQAHGGTVSLVDEKPHGARFVITLPIPGVEPIEPGDRSQGETQEEFSLWPAS